MRADSTDLRERVVAACDAGDATRERVAARFSVSVAWIRKLTRQRRETGSIAPRPHGGDRAPASPADWRPCTGVEAPGDHSQKRSRRAAEQDRPGLKAERAAWRDEFAGVDPSRLVFVGETGASTAMDRTHGRSPSGVLVDGPVPHGRWKVVTLTAAVRLGGVGAGDRPGHLARRGVGPAQVQALRQDGQAAALRGGLADRPYGPLQVGLGPAPFHQDLRVADAAGSSIRDYVALPGPGPPKLLDGA